MIPETAIQAAAKALASDSTAGLIGRDDPNLEWKTWAGDATAALTAALPLLLPTREQIAQAIFDSPTGEDWYACQEAADAVLALLQEGTTND